MTTRSWSACLCAAVLLLVLVACSREPPAPAYVPGLGEIMTQNQMRHAKLWLAGQAGNWPLASYEIDELEEGFHDAAEFHPTHKDSPIPIDEAIEAMTAGPVGALRNATKARDPEAFRRSFDDLTAACNRCHRATGFGFNVVTRPTGSSFLNQDFVLPPDLGQGER